LLLSKVKPLMACSTAATSALLHKQAVEAMAAEQGQAPDSTPEHSYNCYY
jgi:hypothetical protein